jgi:hypothetical protein
MLNKERKNEFKQKWYLFLILNLIALVPDSDVLFRLHRGIFNSLLIPMIIFTAGFTVFLISKLFSDQKKRKKVDFLAFCILLAAFYWGFHIILDLDDGGPNALFYPLDNKTYEISFLLEMTSQAVMPIGFLVDVIFQPLAAGLSTYFLNWTPGQRIDVFGDTFFLSLPGLILNLTIALCWVFFVGREIIPWTWTNKLLVSRQKMLGIFKRVSVNTFTAVGIIFIVFGLFMGPILGQKPVQSISTSRSLSFTPQSISPSFSTNLETMDQILQPQAIHDLSITFTTTSVDNLGNLTWIGIFCLAAVYQNFTSNVIQLFVQHFNTTPLPLNDTPFKTDYRDVVQDFIEKSMESSEPLKGDNTSMTLEVKEPGNYVAAVIIHDWDSYSQFNETVIKRSLTINMEVQYDRSINYSLGMILGVIGVMILIVPSMQELWIHYGKKKEKRSISKSDESEE